MYKTNDILSLILMQNKNSKSSNKNKIKGKKERNREINPFNLRNRNNLSLKSMTQFQKEKPPLQKLSLPFEKRNSNSKKNSQKTHYSKCLTASNSILYNDIYNNGNSNSLNKKNSIKNLNKIDINKDEIINSYEKGVIAIFDILKIILDKPKYDNIKSKFVNEFNINLNNKKGNLNFYESNLNSSNSIKKMIDYCIKKKIAKKKKIKNFQNQLNLRQSHKSLYSLSRSNNKILSQSPNKINLHINELDFVNNFFTEKNNQKNSKSTQYGSSNISGNKTSNSKNFSNKTLINNSKNIELINKNQINKTADYFSCELLSKIKDSLDDDLKEMFNFSYENFLNKESERYDKK